MKNVLLLVHDDAGQEARFQSAVDLGRALGGHLTCVDVAWVPPIVGDGFYDNAYAVAEVLTQERSREAENRLRLEERLRRGDLPWDWIEASGDFASCLAGEAALADVIVVSRQLDGPEIPSMKRTASELVVRADKPVLAVPAEVKGLDLDTPVVAWDGSPASANALRAAIPLLQKASHVTLLSIDDGSVVTPAEDAASYVSRHGVRPNVRHLAAGHRSTAFTLLQEVADGGYGYVVMGGFGHARWVESLFGGVTRGMLTHSPVPVFLAH